MPGTLLTITTRFEKLEKWTVSHVRALEERMDDVERWLVEKEREKEDPHTNGEAGGGAVACAGAVLGIGGRGGGLGNLDGGAGLGEGCLATRL